MKNANNNFIYCPPIFDERKCAHRFAYKLAENFISAGLNLDRHDYTGTAEAVGEFEDITITSIKNDIEKFISNEPATIIALRAGASFALEYSLIRPEQINALILIEPVILGSEYLDHLIRKQHLKDLMTKTSPTNDKGFLNIEGYKTSKIFIDQLKNIDLLESAQKLSPKIPVMIIKIKNSSNINPHISRFARTLAGKQENISIEKFNMPCFWERIPIYDYSKLTKTIVDFCLNNHRPFQKL